MQSDISLSFLASLPVTPLLVFTALTLVITLKLYAHTKHPLYTIPGPPLASWTNALHSYWFLSGRQPYKLLDLHEKYGPVVRTAPNEVSFCSSQSWKDIYGFRPTHKPFVKSPFYDGGSFADQAHSIVSERNPGVHGQMRKDLAHAFSDRSLKDQEYLIAEAVNLFIRQLGLYGSGKDGTDLVMWFNLTTFDIIGSLAFGESFGGLESGMFHFWIKLVTNALRQGALADTMNRFPAAASLFTVLFPRLIANLKRDTKIHEAHTLELIERRLNTPQERPDFLTRILENPDAGRITKVQLAAHASDFVTAGSETTATTLSCATYYLLKTPRVMRLLQDELYSAFTSVDDITASTASKLKYLRAICLEAMRIYAPLPFPLPRVVPEGGDTVDGHYLPGGTIVQTNPVAASMSCANFENPQTFLPERWLGENQKDDLEASQPFSLGARGCLGRNLAWIEMSTILSKLLFTYDLVLLNTDLDWQRDSRMATLWQKPKMRKFSINSLHPPLENKVALVTGGANGIGFASARLLSSLGCKVFILDREALDVTLPEYCEFISCDISSWPSLVSAFRHARTCDIAIANAGVSENAEFIEDFDLDSDTIKEPTYDPIAVNFVGTINFVKLAIGLMRRQKRRDEQKWMQGSGGSIVITSSATGYAPEQSLPVYGATKAGLLNLVRALRSTLPHDNISINSVAPATTITKLLPQNLAAPLIAAGLPVSSAEFVAKAVVYSATATQDDRVEDYGKDKPRTGQGKWNGRCILIQGNTYTEIEGAKSKLKPFWLGMQTERLTRMQQAATDFRTVSAL